MAVDQVAPGDMNANRCAAHCSQNKPLNTTTEIFYKVAIGYNAAAVKMLNVIPMFIERYKTVQRKSGLIPYIKS